jgi:localization factor PodJL
MARAFPVSETTDLGGEPHPADLQALRGELAALLDQVEGQYARSGAVDPAYDGFAQRMRDLRYQVGAGPADRHREALRSVKRQIDRFNDRDEPEPVSARSDDVLQSAIQQIRARTQPTPVPAPMPQAGMDLPRYEDLARAMGGLSSRLEHIDAELKSQRGNASQVKEIADQVTQLSHVMELLAGAIGETGQVKRLEGQIADLARLIEHGGKVDLSTLTQRLDDLSATVERLADLQVQQIQHVVREAESTPQKDAETVKSMRAIELSVRHIYDRIDALERNVGVSPDEIERLTEAMGQFTARMQSDGGRPDSLLSLVDALNARIGDIEDKSETLGALKLDVGELRSAVLGAVEPRFAAIESQIAGLGDKLVAERPDGAGLAQLEAQIRQLVARMDQTGEQLTGLARLYSEPAVHDYSADFEALANLAATRTFESLQRSGPDFAALADIAVAKAAEAMGRPEMPAPLDMEALASIVAGKTSDALSRAALPPAATTLSAEGFAEIEERIMRLFGTLTKSQPSGDFIGMRDGIKEAGERLARIEASLSRPNAAPTAPQAAKAPAPPAMSIEEVSQAAPTPASDRFNFDAPGSAAPAAVLPTPTAQAPIEPVARKDAMPRNPGDDTPLTEFGFPDLGPVRAALEAKNGPRKLHPGMAKPEDLPPQLDTLPLTPEMVGGGRPKADKPVASSPPPAFDPSKVDRPPRPDSSLGAPDDIFNAPAVPIASPPAEAAAPVPASSRNTFIEAARRAAQRQNTAKPPVAANSLIGKALARFQTSSTQQTSVEAVPTAAAPVLPPVPAVQEPAPPPPVAKKKRGQKVLPGDEKPKEMAIAEPVPAISIEPVPHPFGDDVMPPEPRRARSESFLSRHRKPILLAASVIAVSFMALNLVMQRLNSVDVEQSADATPATAISAEPTAHPAPAAPTAAPTPAPSAPATAAPVVSAPTAKPTSDIAPAATPTNIVSSTGPGPRVIPLADPTTTGAIDPSPTMNFATSTAQVAMPAALDAATAAATAATPAPIDSPVKVELPPDTLGPLDLRQAAANGDARAQFEIAAIYSEGRAIPQDFKEAGIWYERAGAQGFAPAQYRLGNLYESGKGVAKDLEQARLWYQRAAEAGNRMAMHNLAALYAGGLLGKQDFASAAEWFEQAATRGMKDSQFNLGMLYARGLGVPQNLETSYKWFALAASSGDPEAAKARDSAARSLDAEAVKRIGADVDGWKPKGIDLVANFAPIGTWTKDFNPGPAITAKDVVQKVQTALVRLGYDIGTPDGHLGPKTTDAIKLFERATGMSEVGAINPRLLAVLGSQPV